MRKRQRQLRRTQWGRQQVLEDRVNSKGNTPTLETTKQDKKNEDELNKFNNRFIPSRQTRANAPIDELHITKGRELPTMELTYPECPHHSQVTIVLPSQF